MDRLPKENSRQALNLLRQAWDEYDVAMYLADRSPLMVIFSLFIFFSWLPILSNFRAIDDMINLKRQTLEEFELKDEIAKLREKS